MDKTADALSDPSSIKLHKLDPVAITFGKDYSNRKSTSRLVWFLEHRIVYDLSHLREGLLGWFEDAATFRCGVYPLAELMDEKIKKVGFTRVFGAPKGEEGTKLPKIYGTLIPERLFEALMDWDANFGIIVAAPTGYGKTVGVNHTIARVVKSSKTKVSGFSVMPFRASIVPMYNHLKTTFPEFNFGYAYRGDHAISKNDHVRLETVGYFLETFVLDYSKHGLPKDRMIIMVDEAHDASWQTDLTLRILLWAQSKGSPIKLIVSSATINIDHTSRMFRQPPLVLSVENQAPNVEVHYLEKRIDPINGGKMTLELKKQMLETVKHILATSKHGDILVMLPGQEDITKFMGEAEKFVNSNAVAIIPLHSQLTKEEINAAILPNEEGKRKLILSTNIVENAITIGGLSYVVDSGIRKINKIDSSGIEELELVPASQSNLKQSLGRVGRVSSRGTAYLMLTEFEFSQRKNYPQNEVETNPLFPQIMKLAQSGMNVKEILSGIEEERIDEDTKFLIEHKILRITADGKLTMTNQGAYIGKLPISIRAGHFFTDYIRRVDQQGDNWYIACLIAVWLDMKTSIFYRPTRKQGEDKDEFDSKKENLKVTQSQFYKEDCLLTFLTVWFEYKTAHSSRDWCDDNGIFFMTLRDIESNLRNLIKALRGMEVHPISIREPSDWETDFSGYIPGLVKSLEEAFKDSVYVRNANGRYVNFKDQTSNMRIEVGNHTQNRKVNEGIYYDKFIAISRRRVGQKLLLSNIVEITE